MILKSLDKVYAEKQILKKSESKIKLNKEEQKIIVDSFIEDASYWRIRNCCMITKQSTQVLTVEGRNTVSDPQPVTYREVTKEECEEIAKRTYRELVKGFKYDSVLYDAVRGLKVNYDYVLNKVKDFCDEVCKNLKLGKSIREKSNMIKAHVLTLDEAYNEVKKSFGKKDISKLQKKQVTDKTGKRTTVYVKNSESDKIPDTLKHLAPAQLKEVMKIAYQYIRKNPRLNLKEAANLALEDFEKNKDSKGKNKSKDSHEKKIVSLNDIYEIVRTNTRRAQIFGHKEGGIGLSVPKKINDLKAIETALSNAGLDIIEGWKDSSVKGNAVIRFKPKKN